MLQFYDAYYNVHVVPSTLLSHVSVLVCLLPEDRSLSLILNQVMVLIGTDSF
jgi:hypothetical protein